MYILVHDIFCSWSMSWTSPSWGRSIFGAKTIAMTTITMMITPLTPTIIASKGEGGAGVD